MMSFLKMKPGPLYLSGTVALAFLLALAACSPNRIAYRGENLTERESGINVTADADGNIIAVSSQRHHYSLVLPYSDKWDFSWKEGYLLIGSAGPVSVVLRATVTEDSPGSHLKMLREMLKRPGAVPGLESARLVKHRGDVVLVTVVDGARATDSEALDGVKHLNVFSVRKWKNLLYRLNISTPYVKGKGARELRSEILDYATAGFSSSYMRDHKASDDDSIGVDSLWRRGGRRN
jgi:hypothetical protein